jgi:hypothetical protein
MKSFSQFLNDKIYEAETPPVVFKGLKGDPYQYKIQDEKTYYAKRSLGTLEPESDQWIEQTSEIGIKAIKDLYTKVTTGLENSVVLDEKTKEKIMDLQGILNEVKKKLPKIWTLPLKIDGDPGWKTCFSWYCLMIVYPGATEYSGGVNDVANYDLNMYNSFKELIVKLEGFKTPFEYLSKFKDRETGALKDIDLDALIKKTRDQKDFINGILQPGSIVENLFCSSIIKSIPENITAQTIDIDSSCPIRTIPNTLKCNILNVRGKNKQNPIVIPKIDCTSLNIMGPVSISPEWSHIEYLSLNDDWEYGPATILKNPIPETLKSIGELAISSPTITSLPDNLSIGEIKENYFVDPPPVETRYVDDKIESEEIITNQGKKKRPWWKRLFGIKESQIYEGYSRYGNLYIRGCYELKTLPKGLTVLGDFYIEGSGIEQAYTDQQIREVCIIKGKILRFGGEEGVLEIPNS